MSTLGHHWISGRPVAGDGERFHALDPTSSAELPFSFAEATADEIEQAMAGAATAHQAWKRLPRQRRVDLLRAIAAGIEALGDELSERAHHETGLPLARLAAERGRTTAQLLSFADLVAEGSFLDLRVDTAQAEREPIPRPDLRSWQQALGPVVVFGASNFPLAFSVAGGDTASALAAGCPVVVKGHPCHPGASELVARQISRAVESLDLPAGTFSLLHGRGHEVGSTLVAHPEARAVGFTGSFAGGKALFDRAVSRERPIPVYAEMGSVNPVFLLPGALSRNPGRLAAETAVSATLGVGQFCTQPGILVVLEGEAADQMGHELGRALVGQAPGTLLSEGIHRAFDAGVDRLRSTPEVAPLIEGSGDSGRWAAPREEGARAVGFRVSGEAFLGAPELREEVFGPVTLLVVCRNLEEMLEVARGLDGQLTATVHAGEEDLAALETLVPILEERAGRLVFGGFPTGVEVCPSMVHGGPYPATMDGRSTSVGTMAIRRWTRPVCYQGMPESMLPAELRNPNPEGLLRLVDGVWSREAIPGAR